MSTTRSQFRRMASAGTDAGKKRSYDYYDFSLLAVVIVLICFGLIMLYSTTAYSAQIKNDDDMYYFQKQALIDLACLVVTVVISWLDYHILEKFAVVLYAVSLFAMLLVKTGLGTGSHGATRWVQIGPISFQPSEIAKLAVIICLSSAIVVMGKKIVTSKAVLVLLGLGLLQFFFAWKVTDNLSTGIIIAAITVGLIFVAHPKTRPFVVAFLVLAAIVALVVFYLSRTMETSNNFRLRRILTWLNPEKYADGDGYQTLQALYAIGSGGFFGRGLGNSIQKLGSIPEAQNDMIFAIICEELGVFGAILLLVLFGYLLYRLIFIAQNAPDLFGSLLVSGIFIHIALQVFLNIGVVVNLIPNTGVTLPFVSYGGTSVLFLLTEIGIALSVSRRIRFQTAG